MSIKPLQIGTQLFPNNLIQGPLAGYTNAPFRELVTRFSQPAFTYTEMLSCKTLNYVSPERLRRFIAIHHQEGPVCFQLSSNNPSELSRAAAKVTELGAHLVDLNCGCPVKKIRSKKSGSHLLSDPELLRALILAMRGATDLPISIKIRVDGHSNDGYNAEVLQVVQESGLDFITVHGRHWTEKYDTPSDRDQIKYFVDRLSIPVIANGDVNSFSALMQLFETGCQGVMVARELVGQPWLIGQWIAIAQGKPYKLPTNLEIGEIFYQHMAALAVLLDSEYQAICAARKMAKYYARQINQKMAFCAGVQACQSLDSFRALCEDYFTPYSVGDNNLQTDDQGISL